jgi:hypothetical protein
MLFSKIVFLETINYFGVNIMKLIQQKHADLPNVAASQLSTLNIPVRNNHHGLILNFLSVVPAPLTQANIETDVAWISVTLTQKGKQIKILDRLTPAEIFDLLNDYREAALSTYTNAGCLYIPYSRPGQFRTQNWALALGMSDVDIYNLQVQFTAGLATTAVVEVIPVVDLEALRPLGEHVEMRVDTRDRAAVGVETIIDAPQREPGTVMAGYHIGLGTAPGVISNVEVILDKDVIYSDLDTAMNNFNMHRRRLTPNADYFHVPMDLDHSPQDVGNAKSFINRWTWSTAPVTYRVVYEMVCGLGQSNVQPATK